MSDVEARYLENYQQIARDHVEHWRATGKNPFQTDQAVRENQEMTVKLVAEYAALDGWLLDAGCGMGDLMMRFPRMYTVGVEFADAYLMVTEERGLNVTKANLSWIPFQAETFDVVTCTDVLEHVLDLNEVMRELHRVLKTGGVIVARVPDMERVAWHVDKYEFVHLRIFDEGTLRLLFERIFDMPVLACVHDGNSLHLAARKQ